ncbi:MAG: DNA gyrase subunit A [Anaerolineales bacterium]|nr:DNA gyrase subunit A [Anaerolineales bacterium]
MEIGNVKQVDISQEMKTSYLSYAMSVIVSRALPDARDGLKPVHRRILYAMHDMGIRPDSAYKKSARIVGEVLGKYHPHSDQAVYDAMVRMAQDFSMRYLLVDGQGNFGSIDGDSPAAMRYTEARLAPMAGDMLLDIDQDTVDFGENFDGSLKEPQVLPSSVPNLLVNGASGIAVGMSTSIPPHNLGEVVDALVYMIDKWAKIDDIGVKDLMEFIKGPDFPTGGIIFSRHDGDADAISAAYATGRGRVTIQACVHIEEMSRNRHRLVITELPFQVNKAKLLERIAELHRDERIEGITDLRDESDRNGMRVIIELTRTVDPQKTLASLLKYTPMQSTFSIIMLVLVNGEPRLLPLKRLLLVFIEHRLEIVRRRSEYSLAQAKARAHILEGLLIVLDNIDEVIDTIRRSRTVETAHKNLCQKFKLSDIQAQAVLNMPLRRLAALEQRKIKEEYEEKIKLIKYLEGLLASPKKMREVIKTELLDLKSRYGDMRRTQIITGDRQELKTSALLPDEMVWVTLTQDGLIARTTTSEFPKVLRKPTKLPQMMLEANTRDTLYLVSAGGKAVSLPVHQLPQADNWENNAHVADLTRLTRRDHVSVATVLPPDKTGFLVLATVGGVVKRIDLNDMPGVMTEEFPVMNVADDDMLAWSCITKGDDEIILVTAAGYAIRFKEEDVRAMGLPAGGVMGIKLKGEEDGVVTMALAKPSSFLWVVADNGFAKYTKLDEYPVHGRYGQGVITMSIPRTARALVGAAVVRPKDKITLITSRGVTKTVRMSAATEAARARQGSRILRLAVRDQVAGLIIPTPRQIEKQES